MTAAPLIRSGQLVPLLAAHATDHLSLYLYYGSRIAQPARVRAFIDRVVDALRDPTPFVLSPAELAGKATKTSRKPRR